jgi:hypothetical protein
MGEFVTLQGKPPAGCQRELDVNHVAHVRMIVENTGMRDVDNLMVAVDVHSLLTKTSCSMESLVSKSVDEGGFDLDNFLKGDTSKSLPLSSWRVSIARRPPSACSTATK